MEVHEIEIEVRPDGTVQAHVQGAKGAACMEYVKLLQQLLQSEGQVQQTAEFYEAPTGVEVRLEQKTTG